MRGHVLQIEPGLILGADGQRYGFAPGEWRAPTPAAPNMPVDFIVADGVARDVFPLPERDEFSAGGAAASVGGRVPEGSSVTLGTIGIVCLAAGFIVPFFPTLAALILGLIGAGDAKRNNNERGLLLSRISWIGAVAFFVIGIVAVMALSIYGWPLLVLGYELLVRVLEDSRNMVPA